MLTSCILQLSHNCKVMPLLLNILFRWLQIFFQGSSTFFFFFFMAGVTICSGFGARKNTVCHCFHFPPCFRYLTWSDWTSYHDLHFFNVEIWARFFTLLFFSSADSLVILHFLSYMWCQEHIWGYWYFSRQSWFLFGLHPAWHFTRCALNIS